MTTLKWQESLRTELSPSKSKIRHDLLYVAISLFAKQFYCEQQLDYDFKLGKCTSEEEKLGTEAHEEIFAGEKIELEELIKSIEEDYFCKCTFPLYFNFNDTLFLGKPDALLFSEGKPLFLIELKTTSGNPYKVYKSEKIQAYSYAFALEYMGFDCSNLHIMLIKMDALSYKLYKDECITTISEEIERKFFSENSVPASFVDNIDEMVHYDIVSHYLDFNRNAFLKDIELASEYWLMKREALGADALKHSRDSKCIVCEYRDNCSAYSHYLDKKGTNQQYLLQMRKIYPKYRSSWTEEDVTKLTDLFSKNIHVNEIAQNLQRSPDSIISKIKQMGFVQPNSTSMEICNRCYYKEKCILDVNKRIEDTHDICLESTNVVYQNRGKSWFNDEISRLRDAFTKNESVYELADMFQRTPKSIIIQLIRNDVISCELQKTMPYLI